MKHLLFVTLIAAFVCSCNAPEIKKEETPESKETIPTKKHADNIIIMDVENAHKLADFQGKSNISFDIELTFGGSKRLNGTITLSTDSRKGKIINEDKSEIIYSDNKVFTSSPEMNQKSARFSAYTWPYFFLFPYKLSDDGTIWNSFENQSLNGTDYDTQKLTFESGTGDAPDDWYILYADTQTNLTRFAAYIVTAGGSSQEEAEEDPHAIEYLDYKLIDGIPISHEWKFWAWRTEDGLTDQLGFAKISNVKFLKVEDDFYSITE